MDLEFLAWETRSWWIAVREERQDIEWRTPGSSRVIRVFCSSCTNPVADSARKSKAAQTRFRAILRLAQARPELFDRITALLDELDQEHAG